MLLTYEQKQRNKLAAFILIVAVAFFSLTLFADTYESDTIYGTTKTVDRTTYDYVRGSFVNWFQGAIEKICQTEILEGNLKTAFDNLGIDSTLSEGSTKTLDELNGTDDNESSTIFNDTDGMLLVWFDLSDDLEVAGVSLGGDSYSEGTEFTGVAEFIKSVNSATRTIGMAMLIIFFCVSLMQGYLEGNQYEEIIMKKMIVFGFSLALLYYIQVICAEFCNLTNVLILTTQQTYDTTETVGADMYAYLYSVSSFLKESGKFWENTGRMIYSLVNSIPYFLSLLVPYGIAYACEIIIAMTCLSRFIEIAILIAMAPIAMCTIGFGRGLDSIMRFIKAFLAVCLQGAVIFVTFKVIAIMRADILSSYVLKTNSADSILQSCIMIVLLTVIQSGIVGRSRQIAQTVIGS